MSEVSFCALESDKRMDSEYYRPLFLKYESLLKQKKSAVECATSFNCAYRMITTSILLRF